MSSQLDGDINAHGEKYDEEILFFVKNNFIAAKQCLYGYAILCIQYVGPDAIIKTFLLFLLK